MQLSTELGSMLYYLLDLIYSGRTRSPEDGNYENVWYSIGPSASMILPLPDIHAQSNAIGCDQVFKFRYWLFSFRYETRISYDGNHDHTYEDIRQFNSIGNNSELKKVTTMIRLDDDTEFEMIETPDIPGPQLIADIGGMAGFMLGRAW